MKYINTTVFALLSQVMPKLSSTLLFIGLARRTGQAGAGAYSLAVSFLSIAILLCSFGLEDILIREVARSRAVARLYFKYLLGLRVLIILGAWCLLWASVTLIFNYPWEIESTIFLLALTLLPESVTDLAQSLMVAIGKIRWTAISSSIVSVAQFVTGVVVLITRPNVQSLLIVLVIYSFLACLLNLYLAFSLSQERRAAPAAEVAAPVRLPPGFWNAQLRNASAFVIINVFAVLEIQMDVLLLSAFRTIEQLGTYGAAKTLITSFAMLAQAFRVAIYPRLASLYPSALQPLAALYQRLFRYLAAFSLPLAAVVIIEAPFLVNLIYTSRFEESVLPLQILAVSLAVNFLYIPSTRLIVAASRERQLVVLVAFSFFLNLAANLILIPRYGIVGSATARSLSITIYFVLSELLVNWRLITTRWFPHLLRIFAPVAVMCVVMVALYSWSPVGAAVVGGAVYTAVLLVTRGIEVEHLRSVASEYRSAFDGLRAARHRPER